MSHKRYIRVVDRIQRQHADFTVEAAQQFKEIFAEAKKDEKGRMSAESLID